MTDNTDTKSDSNYAPPVAYRRLMVACVAAMFVFAACVIMPSVGLHEIGKEFDLNFASRGLVVSVRTGALVVSLLVFGYLADLMGKQRFLPWSLVVTALGLAASARTTGYRALLGAQALVGVGTGVLEALLNPLVAQLGPRNAARHLNIVNGMFSVGLVSSALLAGELLQAGRSWRLPFWLWVVPTLLTAALFVTRGYPTTVSEAGPGHEMREFLRRRLFWLLFVAMVLGGGCEGGITAWAASFVEEEFGASARSGAWTVALYGASMAVGRFGTGALVARITPLSLMIGSAVGCALATWGLCFVQELWAAWVLFSLGGLFVACFWPTILSVGSDNIAAGSSSLFALLAAAGILGCVIFPWGIGVLGDAFGLRAGVALLPVAMVLLAVVLVAASRRVSREV